MAEAQDEGEIEAEGNKGGDQLQQQNNLEKSSSSSFLWRGLRLGKRIAIAGAAIVAVPAVIPTIFVGVAFAFPFGAYMAGFALTDRVMRSLLSTSSSEIGILEDGNEKGVLKKETEAEERDEPTQLAAEQEIDMWPPTTNSTILIEEEDDFVGIGIGQEKHAEERDEPTPLDAEPKNDMWPPTTNSNVLVEEGDGFGGIGIGGEGRAEEKDEPSPWTAEEKIDMWSPTTNLDSLTEKGDDFVGTVIGKESHAEGVTDGEQGIYDPEQETKIKFKHTSSIEDKEDIIADIGMKNEVRRIQAERGVEENEERRERGKNDKQNSNEELKIWSSEIEKPFEVIGKGEKKKTNDEMEIQGLAAAVLEVKQYPMTAYPSTTPEGINNETNQIILSSECPAAIKKRDITTIEEAQQPEMFVERRSGETEDMVQDANEERVNENDGIELIQSSYVFESAIEQPSPEENRYKEGVETIGLTAASKIANEKVLSENYTVEGMSIPIPKVEDSSVCYSFVSPLECENQMATLNLSKEYASPSRDPPSDVTDVENGPAHTVVETLGALHFNDEVPNGQDEVEREGHPLVQNQIDLSPLTIYQNTPNEEGKNMDGMQISEESRIKGLSGREPYSSDAEQDARMKFEYASSISYDDVKPDLGMVLEEREILAESGLEKSEHRDEMENLEGEKVVNEKQRIRNMGNSSTLNDPIQRGHANKEGGDIVIELSGNETVDKKKAEEDMEIQGLAAAVPEATTPFADLPPANVETMEFFPTVHHSLDAVPEEHEIDFELPGMSSKHKSSAVTIREGEEKTVKEANEENVIGQDGMEPKQRNDVIASIVPVEEQFAIEQNLNDPNAEDGSSDVTYNIEEANDSFVAAIPLESERETTPSSLSTEYASAVEDQSSCVTDAKSEPSVTGVETGEMVHFHDEVSYGEETIWEQIYALRTIVGHRAALHSSLVEELKALYLVTGVEPPVSLNDASDIMEITDKLMFLKFVVGVE